MRAGLREFEADEPFAGNAAAIYLWGAEFPLARSLLREAGEIFAGAGRIESCVGDAAGSIDVYANHDSDGTLNGGERFRRSFGQHRIEDFPSTLN